MLADIKSEIKTNDQNGNCWAGGEGGIASNQGLARLLPSAYRALARRVPLHRLLPASLRPRVFLFQARQRSFFKLMMGGRVLGHYDGQQKQWHIDRLFHLFVDEDTLPFPREGESPMPGEARVPGQID